MWDFKKTQMWSVKNLPVHIVIFSWVFVQAPHTRWKLLYKNNSRLWIRKIKFFVQNQFNQQTLKRDHF